MELSSLRLRTVSLLILLLLVFTVDATVAQTTVPARDTADVVEADSSSKSQHPNAVPYRSSRSVWAHALAAPSYLVYGVTRPIGWGVKYLEREYPALFEPRAPVQGVLPLVELGGPVGVQGGVAVFDHDLWGLGHDARLSFIYGSRSRYEVDLDYRFGPVFGPHTTLTVNATFLTNPERRYFLRGNRADRRDETRYFTRQLSGRATLTLKPLERLVGDVEVEASRTFNKRADGDLGDRLPVSLPGVGRATALLTARTGWTIDRTAREQQRIVRGTRVRLEGEATEDLSRGTFRYVGYAAEIQQYLPLPFLPSTRRLALRVRMEKVEPARGGAAVPFFRLPGIGGQTTVRSLVFERYVEEGALVANAEYQYPIWNRMDAVAFVDAGQVFNEFEGIAVDRFHYSYGGGVRVIRGGRLAFRFEVATGEEGLRTILTVNQMF
ncbi:MAG TPA: BamA/TamA family outer membrane protein [Longibacter sp.]